MDGKFHKFLCSCSALILYVRILYNIRPAAALGPLAHSKQGDGQGVYIFMDPRQELMRKVQSLLLLPCNGISQIERQIVLFLYIHWTRFQLIRR